jgi:CheY-like chemotaxis protein
VARALNILLIEDNDDDAFLLKASVRNLALSITHVRTANAAVDLLANAHTLPDLIVLDLTLPGMTSAQFLEWAASNPVINKIPICIYTGAPAISDQLKNSVRGAFSKSPIPSEIRDTVQQMCALLHD